jgi:hypothetical protein
MNFKEKTNKFQKVAFNSYAKTYKNFKFKKRFNFNLIKKKRRYIYYNLKQLTLWGNPNKSKKYLKIQQKKEGKYKFYVKNFVNSKVSMQNLIGRFFSKRLFFRKNSLQFVFKKYKKHFKIDRKISINEQKFSFKEYISKRFKKLFIFLKKIKNVFNINLVFSLKKFFEYYILRLFCNFNFKFYFFQLLQKITKALNVKEKYLFLKYEFFGHSYFKHKIFFILRYKLLYFYFFQAKKPRINFKVKYSISNTLVYKNFFIKLFFLRKMKYNYSFIKNWLLNFFLNKYQFPGYSYKNTSEVFEQKDYISLSLVLKNIFFLYYSIYDRNFKSFIINNKKFTNWLFYNINRKKQKIKNLFEIFGYEDDFFPLSDSFNKSFLSNIYKSLVFMHLSIKLNNVFVTLSNFKGKVFFKYSTGFYGISGRKKRDPLTLYNIINNIFKRLKKFPKLNLVLKIKRRLKNKYFRQVLNSLSKNRIMPLCFFLIVNRNISKRRLRKVRRL